MKNSLFQESSRLKNRLWIVFLEQILEQSTKKDKAVCPCTTNSFIFTIITWSELNYRTWGNTDK